MYWVFILFCKENWLNHYIISCFLICESFHVCLKVKKEGATKSERAIIIEEERKFPMHSHYFWILIFFLFFSFLYLGNGRLLITWLALCLYMHCPLPNRWYAPQSSNIVVKYWSGISCGTRGLIPMSSLLEFGTTHKVMILNWKYVLVEWDYWNS